MTTQSLPCAHLGEALATDYFQVREQFTDEQWDHFITTRRFVDEEVLPAINDYWEAAELPWPLVRRPPLALRVGRARARRGGVRRGSDLHQAARPVREAALRLPDRPGAPRPHALGNHGMQLYCMQLARFEEAGQLTDTIAGLAKFNNTRKARAVIADARDMLGGNGVLLSNHVIRHMGDIEVIHTFEGTETMQALIVGRDITGVGAFA
jgi:Acyl-CoA dehydrogenase, C-terminal domain